METTPRNIRASEIQVERKSVYAPFRKRSSCYVAQGKLFGVEYSERAPTRKEAIELAKSSIAYVASAGEFKAGGCELVPVRHETWLFKLPSGSGMLFGSPTLRDALQRVTASYAYRDDLFEFHSAAALFLG